MRIYDDDDDDDGRQWKLGVISTDHDEAGVTESLTTVHRSVHRTVHRAPLSTPYSPWYSTWYSPWYSTHQYTVFTVHTNTLYSKSGLVRCSTVLLYEVF